MLQRLIKEIRSAYFFQLFNYKDELAKGRCSMLISAVIGSVNGWLTGGLFYTSFLMANGINLVNIGIISFVPYIAHCFSIFSPMILERFPKRKKILLGSSFITSTLSLLVLTFMPRFISDPTVKMVLFVILIFTTNIITSLFSSGWTAWHVKFIPDSVRAEYFSASTLFTAFIGCGSALISSVVADALSASAYKDTIIVVFRLIAFGLAMLNLVNLAIPKEYPYERSAEIPRLRHIVTKPFQHKKFMLTMCLAVIWSFCVSCSPASLNYYLINDVGVSYSFIYIINMFYPFFLMAFLPFWKRILRKQGWLKTIAIGAILHLPTNLLYSCVTSANYIWLMPLVRLTQHFFGVGFNVAYANILYINLPEEDQTNYISFYTLITNIAGFLGSMAATTFIARFPDLVVTIFGLRFTNVQMLLWMDCLGDILLPLGIMLLLKQITPDAEE